MKNVQIVNGGQTSNALFEAFANDPQKVEDVLVLVKIFETRSSEISYKIAESTNSQTPIRTRDLRSNDYIQKKLEEEFKDQGYFYERKTNQHIDKEKSKRVDLSNAAQAYIAYVLGEPEIAYGQKSKIFTEEYYGRLFNENRRAKDFLVPFQIVEQVDKRKNEIRSAIRGDKPYDKSLEFLLYGTYHVVFTIGVICDLKNIDKFELNNALAYQDEAISIIKKVLQKDLEASSVRTQAFFKDRASKDKIRKMAESTFVTNV
jgi:hypothetical protein